jgi:integrase
MVFKRGRVYWYRFRWHLKTANGETEYYVVERSARTQNAREAQNLQEDHRRALREGRVHPLDPFPEVPPPAMAPMTLREYADVLLRHVALHRKPRTVGFYEECLARIEKFPRLALAPVGSVTADLIEAYAEWRRTRRKGNSAWAINGELRTLRRILRYAEEKGQIAKAPKIHVLPGCKGRDRVLSAEEESAYLAKASGKLKDAAILGIETGLRPDSELFVLRWENVTAAGLRIESGKTPAAVRTVPLSPRARAVLDLRRRAAKNGKPFVFPSRSKSGHLITLIKRHAQACRDAGLDPFPVYTWRHTYGTRCAESGVDRYTLARWMGHSSPSVTAKYYVHVTERHEQAGFEKFVEYTEKLRTEVMPLASQKTDSSPKSVKDVKA